MSLKETLEVDLDIFFNVDEFAEPVIIDQQEVVAIVSNSLRKGSKKLHDNMGNNYSEGGRTYTLKTSDFMSLQTGNRTYDEGSRIAIDEELYKVHKITNDGNVTHLEVKIYD